MNCLNALEGATLVLGVMPSAHARRMYTAMLPHIAPGAAIVSATKGLEPESLLRMTEVVAQVFSPKFPPRLAALSGPSFAREVARGDPTAIVIGAPDAELTREVQEEFAGPTFRLYRNSDVVGVEIGGAVKNVIAIAAGVVEGLGFGHNTLPRSSPAVWSKCRAWPAPWARAAETMAGWRAWATSFSPAPATSAAIAPSGVELGKGRPLAEITGSMRMVAEGVGTTAATLLLSRRLGIEMPITEQMHAVLYEGRAPRDAIRELMERRLKHE